MREEIWRPVVGYEGLYEVSNLGRVKSLFDNLGHRRDKILKASHIQGKKYLRVTLCNKVYKKCKKIQVLVATAFITNPDNLPCVNHKDENPENNCVDNLEWCTYKYNSNYGTAIKRRSEKMKGYFINNKHTSKSVLCIETNKTYPSINEAYRSTGIKSCNISQCCNNIRKTAGGFHWRFA